MKNDKRNPMRKSGKPHKGQSLKASSKAKELQLYRTPHHITEALLRRERFSGKVWEPCVGRGDVAAVLKQHGYRNVLCSDIHNWKYPGTVVQDFLKAERKAGPICTNPPHRNPQTFVRQAKRLADKVAMLLPMDFEAAVGSNDLRADKEYPIKAVYAFTQGIHWLNVKEASNKIKFGWFVWERGFSQPTIREWITFDTKTLTEVRQPNADAENDGADYKPPNQLAFPYPGSKWTLMKEYLKHFPPHHTWVSVFGGTGAEIALKPPSKMEVWNDIDRCVHGVFEVLQNTKLRKRLMNLLENTPNGRQQYEKCSKIVRSPGSDPVKNAWAFLMASITGYTGVHPYVSVYWAGKSRRNTGKRLRQLPEILEQWRQRFRLVKLENDQWHKILNRYDASNTFFFVDPPYHPDTLDRRLYYHDMTATEHEELLAALQNVQGKVMLCGYDHPLYRKFLSGWRRIEFPTRSQISKEKSPRTEVIWTNYPAEDGSGTVEKKPSPSRLPPPARKKRHIPEKAETLKKALPPPTIPMPQPFHLSDIDSELLENIDQRQKTIATMVRSVKDGDTTAFFLYGPGGHGKSKLIRDALCGYRKVKIWNADMSARALVERLEEFPGYVHFFEDLEKVYRDHDCQGILIAACGGKKGHKRIVQWNKHRVNINFEFTGGIITSNTRLDPKPGRLGAVASRFSPQEWKLTDPELAAVMRHIALTEYRSYGLTQAEAWEVGEFMVTEMEQRSGHGKVDLRTLCEQAIPDYKQWRDGRAEVHWHDLVRARINGGPVSEGRKSRTERRQYVACEVFFTAKNLPARLKLWKSQTLGEGPNGEGLGKSAFYDRLKEAKASGLFAQMEKIHRGRAA